MQRFVIVLSLACLLALAGCTVPAVTTDTSDTETVSAEVTATETVTVTATDRGWLACENPTVPAAPSPEEPYPQLPATTAELDAQNLTGFVHAFERAYLYDNYYASTYSEFWMTVSEPRVVNESERRAAGLQNFSAVVYVGAVQVAANTENGPLDYWAGVTYLFDDGGIVRSEALPRQEPELDSDASERVVVCE